VVLLDVDGTLVDSNDAHAFAWVEALREAGHDISFERVRRLIGQGADKVIPETTGVAKDSVEGRAIEKRRARLFAEKYLPHLRPFEGAADLLARMHDEGLRLVAASSAKEDELNALLDITGGGAFFDRKTSSDDASRSKPDPDIVEAALRKARCSASEAMMLGDTPYDVMAASASRVQCIAVRSGGWSDDDLRGAVAIYDGAKDLLRRYDDSPFGAASRQARLPEARSSGSKPMAPARAKS
jgi:phosphoglycolate phosphatase-like HAD superfamily hydrolase